MELSSLSKRDKSAVQSKMKVLIIVESQTKAKTITKILNNIDGNTYTVMSSLGHICNLDNIKHNKLGIDVTNNYAPVYTQVKDRKPLIKKLIEQAKQSDRIIIASDEDREGEAIGWHLANTLKLDVKIPTIKTANNIKLNNTKYILRKFKINNLILLYIQYTIII